MFLSVFVFFPSTRFCLIFFLKTPSAEKSVWETVLSSVVIVCVVFCLSLCSQTDTTVYRSVVAHPAALCELDSIKIKNTGARLYRQGDVHVKSVCVSEVPRFRYVSKKHSKSNKHPQIGEPKNIRLWRNQSKKRTQTCSVLCGFSTLICLEQGFSRFL